MNYVKQVQWTINYIEKDLLKDWDIEEIADAAGFSMYYFHRMFNSITGYGIKEYIRKRRLNEAIKEIEYRKESIEFIAKKYNFTNQQYFTRAFKNFFGYTPGRARRFMLPFKKFEHLQVYKNDYKIKGDFTMEVTIKKVGPLSVIGQKVNTTQKENKIPQLWQDFMPRMMEIKGNIKKNTALGLCFFDPDTCEFDENNEFSYLAGVMVDQDKDIPTGMMLRELAEIDYAVFTHKGSLDKLDKTYKYIFAEWLPNSEYEHADSDEIEWYDDRFKFGEDDSEFDIYIPVIKKMKN